MVLRRFVSIVLLYGAVGVSRKAAYFRQAFPRWYVCWFPALLNHQSHRKNVPIISVWDTKRWTSSPCLVTLRESCKAPWSLGLTPAKSASLPETASKQKPVAYSNTVKMEPMKALELESPLQGVLGQISGSKGWWPPMLAQQAGTGQLHQRGTVPSLSALKGEFPHCPGSCLSHKDFTGMS